MPPSTPAAEMRKRPPTAAETDGAATDPARRIRSPRRRPAQGSRPPHASRPRSTPASRRGRANPVRPPAGPARQRPPPTLPNRTGRTSRGIASSTDGGVSSCRMPVSGSSASNHRPGLAGPAPALESGHEALAGPALLGVRQAAPPAGRPPVAAALPARGGRPSPAPPRRPPPGSRAHACSASGHLAGRPPGNPSPAPASCRRYVKRPGGRPVSTRW